MRQCLFNVSESVGMLFQQLFVYALQNQSLSLIALGFASVGDVTHSMPLFEEMQKLFREAIKHPNDANWIALIRLFLEMVHSAIVSNRQLLVMIDQFNWLNDAAKLGLLSDTLEDRMALVDRFLNCCLSITRGSPYWRRKFVQQPIRTVVELIKGLHFGTSTIDLFLQLTFETPISITAPPRVAQIANQKILPFLHEVTKHLPVHPTIFQFISSVTHPSLTNILRVFRSPLLVTALNYVRSFASHVTCSPEQQT
jgi:hypothetical protein